jgi:phospholipid transport system substrate-binding protein
MQSKSCTDALGRRGLRIGRRGALTIIAAGALSLASPAHAQTSDVRRFIETVGRRTVDTLADESLASQAKLERLRTILEDATDLPVVARLVLGRHWREASEAQRVAYVELFQALVIKTMADRLSTYGGETFEITGARPADDRDSIVSTRILRPTGTPPLAVDWRVRDAEGRLAIVDIVAEGISMVVTQRSEVNEIVSRQGIDGLLSTMRERLQRPA